MNHDFFTKVDHDGTLAKKVLAKCFTDSDTFSNIRNYMYDTAEVSITDNELTRIINKKNITPAERFILEWAIINQKCSTSDYLQICERDWKQLLDARAQFVLLRNLMAEKHLHYRELLSTYLEKCERINEVMSLLRTAPAQSTDCVGTKTIALAGNCNLDYLARFLELGVLTMKLDISIYNSGFDQWISQLHEENSELYRSNPSILIVYLSSLGLTRAASVFHLDQAEFFSAGLEKFLAKSRGMILVLMPEPLEEEFSGDCRASQWRREWGVYLQQWIQGCRQTERILFCDLEPVVEEVGREKWFAPRYWYHAKLPCSVNAHLPLGRYLLKYVTRMLSQPVKVIVCDLDNTLWGGIVGEDGWQNIDLDPNGSGGAFIRLQALLKYANDNGILLAIASKNDEMIVREVFDRREEMLLRWNNFSAVQINWSPKPANIKALARDLNIGLPHFCFLDDSAFERAAVSEALPDVWVPDLPETPDQYVSYLIKTGLFIFPRATDVDRARPALYRDELARKAARETSVDYDSFLKGLSIQLHPMDINDNTLSRCEQLLQRTNQFNVTVLRLSQTEIDTYLQNSNVFSKCYRVIDRFGDSGIVGVLIAVPEEPNIYRILCWVLSCRVLGRYIEHAMFDHLIGELLKNDVKTLRCRYVPTSKNTPTAGLLPALGFTRKDDSKEGKAIDYHLELKNTVSVKHYVDIIRENEG